jgi:GLPGLI family protein
MILKNLIIIIALGTTTLFFSQEKNKNMEITYTYSEMNGYITHDHKLLIKDEIAQYVVMIEEETKKHPTLGFTTKIPRMIQINNYNYQTDIFEEERKLKNNKYINAKWHNNTIWKITDETKIISGYKVIKATTESYESNKDSDFYRGKAIAWFTTAIPVSAGPGRYAGLPGLILEIAYEKNNATYKLKKIAYKDNVVLLQMKNDAKNVGKTILLDSY